MASEEMNKPDMKGIEESESHEEDMFGAIGLMMKDSDSDDEVHTSIEIKYDDYDRKVSSGDSIKSLHLALVKRHHSLWAEYIYNAARVMTDMIDCNEINVKNMKCLELGAGAGLPSIIAALNEAKEVVISDYGHFNDMSLMAAIDINISYILPYLSNNSEIILRSAGYIWGNPIDELVYGSEKSSYRQSAALDSNISDTDLFDVILLADLLFNRSEHRKLLWTVKKCLKSYGQAIVTFSHHDPEKSALDLKFFEYATEEEYNFKVEKLGEEKRSSYPFVENDGLDELRGYVHIYRLTHASMQEK